MSLEVCIENQQKERAMLNRSIDSLYAQIEKWSNKPLKTPDEMRFISGLYLELASTIEKRDNVSNLIGVLEEVRIKNS